MELLDINLTYNSKITKNYPLFIWLLIPYFYLFNRLSDPKEAHNGQNSGDYYQSEEGKRMVPG